MPVGRNACMKVVDENIGVKVAPGGVDVGDLGEIGAEKRVGIDAVVDERGEHRAGHGGRQEALEWKMPA